MNESASCLWAKQASCNRAHQPAAVTPYVTSLTSIHTHIWWIVCARNMYWYWIPLKISITFHLVLAYIGVEYIFLSTAFDDATSYLDMQCTVSMLICSWIGWLQPGDSDAPADAAAVAALPHSGLIHGENSSETQLSDKYVSISMRLEFIATFCYC